MQFSNRLPQNLDPSPWSLKLAAYSANCIDLTLSNPTRAGLNYPKEAREALGGLATELTYRPEALGEGSAREAVATYGTRLGRHWDAAHLMLTASTSEAYGLLFKLLCNPGDEIFIATPGYPLVPHLAQLEGVQCKTVPLIQDNQAWHCDFDGLERAIQATMGRTKAIVVVHPNNPTGHGVSRDEALALAHICRRYSLALISDEVFAPYGLDGKPLTSVQTLLPETSFPTFVLDGLSKGACLPQAKLAWVHVGGKKEIRAACMQALSFLGDAYLSPSSAIQRALPTLLTDVAPMMQSQVRERCQTNLRELRKSLAAEPCVDVQCPEAGWYALVRLPQLMTDEAWTLHLAAEHGVLVQPGFLYDFEPGKVWLVISLLQRPEVFAKGCDKLLTGVQSALAKLAA